MVFRRGICGTFMFIYDAKIIILNQTVIIFNIVDDICKHAESSALELKTQGYIINERKPQTFSTHCI